MFSCVLVPLDAPPGPLRVIGTSNYPFSLRFVLFFFFRLGQALVFRTSFDPNVGRHFHLIPTNGFASMFFDLMCTPLALFTRFHFDRSNCLMPIPPLVKFPPLFVLTAGHFRSSYLFSRSFLFLSSGLLLAHFSCAIGPACNNPLSFLIFSCFFVLATD